VGERNWVEIRRKLTGETKWATAEGAICQEAPGMFKRRWSSAMPFND
jgi:hypothetical protein